MDLDLTAESLLNAAPGARYGATVVLLPSTASTQDVGRDLARDGAAPGTVVCADRQSAGRGAGGRTWLAEPGAALLMSVLVPVPARPEAVPWLTPTAAIATAQALRGLTRVPPRLKWPNDVLLAGRKVGGVLTEMAGGAALAVVGIGINVRAAPVVSGDLPATCVADWATHPVTRGDVGARLVRELGHLLPRLERGRADHVKEAWRLLLDTAGRRVRVDDGNAVVTGLATAIDGAGALIVRTDDGRTLRLDPGGRAILRHLVGPPAPVDDSGGG